MASSRASTNAVLRVGHPRNATEPQEAVSHREVHSSGFAEQVPPGGAPGRERPWSSRPIQATDALPDVQAAQLGDLTRSVPGHLRRFGARFRSLSPRDQLDRLFRLPLRRAPQPGIPFPDRRYPADFLKSDLVPTHSAALRLEAAEKFRRAVRFSCALTLQRSESPLLSSALATYDINSSVLPTATLSRKPNLDGGRLHPGRRWRPH